MRTRKSAATRKAEIVEAALRLADRLGPDRMSTEAVANAVGITQAGLFRHFPRKQVLWEAVADRIGTMMEEGWAEALRGKARPGDKIRALVVAQLRLIRATPAIPAILFSRELHTDNDGLRTAFLALLGRFHRRIAGLVGEGIDAGEWDADLDPGDAAFLILGLVQGLAVRWSVAGRGFDLVAEGERLLELLLRGFARPPAGTARPESRS